MSQIVIEVPPDVYVTPEIIEDVKDLVRHEIFSERLTNGDVREYEMRIKQLVTEDDEPVDNIFSEKQQKFLTQTLYSSWKPVTELGEPRLFFSAANIGLFAKLESGVKPIVPDVLVSLDVTAPKNVHEKRHRSYMVWEFGKPPELVLEVVSNEVGGELDEKMKKYARIGIEYYVVFDPARFLSADVLRVYEKTPADGYRSRDDFFIPALRLGLTFWQGTFESIQDTWLRWIDESGNLLASSDERAVMETERADVADERAAAAVERAAQEAQARREAEERTENLAAKLRELGVDPEKI